MADGAKALYGSIVGAGGSSGGGGGGGVTPDNTFDVYVYDNLETYASWHTYFPFKEGMTWGEFVESPLNPNVDIDNKVFSNSYGAIYYNLYLTSEWMESSYLGVSESDPILPFDSETYQAAFENQCLVAGTKIKTAKGSKNVENIKRGDTVTSIDPETLELTTATVGQVRSEYVPHERMFSDKWFRYSFDDGSEFHITGKHRFFNMDTRKYEWAENFKIGDRAYKIDGTTPKLVSVEKIDERVEYNTFWNVNREAYFVDGFLSGNARTPIPQFPVEK